MIGGEDVKTKMKIWQAISESNGFGKQSRTKFFNM